MARHPERDKLRKQAISITLDGNDIAFIDQGIRHRMFQSRSHAVAWALQLLRQHVAHIMRLQQEEARRLEEAARKGVQAGSIFPPPGPMPPNHNPDYPPR
jgi:Arc/MetJ-type ribon-helix-helix transcriptional regulator